MKHSLALSLYLVLSFSLFAQNKAPLGEKEIQGVKRIEFINKSTARASLDIREENQELGRKLAQGVSKGSASSGGVSVTRISPSEDGKLGADIISIEPSQGFDHINSIQRIISAYVEGSFQYKSGGADTISQYILYYNAAHRKDMKFFSSKYSDSVNKALSADKAGIDTNYSNWPGRTQIVVPIEKNILKDGGKDVTTDELEKEVNKIVQDKEKDPATKQKMTEEAKKMDTLQTKKIVEEKKIVQEKKQEVAKEEKKIEQKKEELKKKESETLGALAELKKDPAKNKDDIAKKEAELNALKGEKAKVEEKAQALEAKKEELDKKEEELVQKGEERKEGAPEAKAEAKAETKEEPKVAAQVAQEQAKQAEEKAQVAEAKAEKLEKELTEVKEELKKKEEQSDNVVNDKVLFLKFIKYDSDGHYSNELWAIDTTKDDAMFRSPYNNICSKEFKEIPNQGVLVLGYDGDKVETRKHKLVILDPEKLAVKKTSEAADIFWRTPMVYREDKIYVIEKYQDKHVVSRFKPDLTVEVRSQEGIEENSEITFYKDKIYVTGKPKEGEKALEKTTIKIFNKDDLSLIKTIAP